MSKNAAEAVVIRLIKRAETALAVAVAAGGWAFLRQLLASSRASLAVLIGPIISVSRSFCTRIKRISTKPGQGIKKKSAYEFERSVRGCVEVLEERLRVGGVRGQLGRAEYASKSGLEEVRGVVAPVPVNVLCPSFPEEAE